MGAKKPLPSISRRAPNARPAIHHHQEVDPEEATTIKDFFPTGDVDERVSDVAKTRRGAVEAPDDGFVMDFESGTPAPIKRR